MDYKVTWEINIEADSAREAAEKAQQIQRSVTSTAQVFNVDDGTKITMVDLMDWLPEHEMYKDCIQ